MSEPLKSEPSKEQIIEQAAQNGDFPAVWDLIAEGSTTILQQRKRELYHQACRVAAAKMEKDNPEGARIIAGSGLEVLFGEPLPERVLSNRASNR
jgi:hypothetical protein